MGQIKSIVYNYYRLRGLSEEQIQLRYKSIQLIILFNYKLESAIKELAIQEEWYNSNDTEKTTRWSSTIGDFKEILVQLGMGTINNLRGQK